MDDLFHFHNPDNLPLVVIGATNMTLPSSN
jgi:hypothetical protein